MRVESYNVSTDSQDVSPDRVFDFEAASRSTASPKEAQQLQQLREKLEKEFEEVPPHDLMLRQSEVPGSHVAACNCASVVIKLLLDTWALAYLRRALS